MHKCHKVFVAAAFAICGIAGAAFATPVVVAKWTFNDGTINPSTGAGTMTLVGGVAAASSGAFASGTGSTDGGSAYNTSGYPAQGTASGAGGFEFDVSTAGYTSVTVSFDGRTSATASRNYEIMYSTDGGATWNDSTVFSPFTDTNFHNNNVVDLSGIGAANDNAAFRVRIVSVFQPGTSAYQASGATSTYNGSAGTFRIDAVTISGEPAVSLPPTGTGSAAPGAGCDNDTTLLTVSTSPGQNPTSQMLSVQADLTAVGGSATQQFFDDGSNGDLAPNDGVFSFSIAATGAPGPVAMTATVTDDQNRSSPATIHYAIGNCSGNSASTVVISQVYGGGGGAGAVFDGDFVELFNRSAGAVTLDGWSVQYASSGGTFNPSVRLLSGSIAPGGYYLVRMSNQTPGDPLPTPDAGGDVALNGGIFMSNNTGQVYLSNGATLLTGCSDSSIMDKVGYGPLTTCFEGAGPAIDLTAGSAALRKNGGCQDSDENFNDFERLFPTPRNSASPLNPCGGGSTGACCTGNTCSIMTQADCTTAGGTWAGTGTTCSASACGVACGSADFNCDGDTGTDADIESFFACLAGNCPTLPCLSTADFNGDGDTGTDADIEAFFRVLAGGNC